MNVTLLGDVLIRVVQKFPQDEESERVFRSFEGDSVTLHLRGDRTVTFMVKDGRPIVVEGEIENPSAIAEIDVGEFIKFIDGSKHFGELFTTEFGTYFQARKGEFYDLGGDFMLLGPFSDRLIKAYKADPEFRNLVNSFALRQRRRQRLRRRSARRGGA